MFDFELKITTLLLRASPRRYPILKNQIGNMIFWIVCVYIYFLFMFMVKKHLEKSIAFWYIWQVQIYKYKK